MKRRDLLAGTAIAAATAHGQPSGGGTIYIPQAHRVEDRALLHDFMDEFSFAELVTASPSIRITHLPVLLDRRTGAFGTLYGHIARNNPQSKVLEEGGGAVVIFRGPHSYISPSWFGKKEAVPTWNFAVVHASGKLKMVADNALHDLLAQLVSKFENKYGNGSYDFAGLPDSFTRGLMSAIAGFELRIDLIEGKFKLGQDRDAAGQIAMLAKLESAKQDRSMRDFTASFYERLKKTAQGKPAALTTP